MFAGLAAAVEGTTIPTDAAAIATLARLIDRLQAKLLAGLGAFDAAGGPEVDGSLGLGQWVARNTPLANPRRVAATAKKLHRMPDVRDAHLAGGLDSGQVDAITTGVPERHLDTFNQSELLPALTSLRPSEITAVLHRWRDAADAGQEPRVEPASSVHLSPVGDRGILNGDLDPLLYGKLKTALELADSGDLDTPAAQRRAGAFETIVDEFLDTQRSHRVQRRRPHVNITVQAEDLTGAVVDGPALDRPSIGMLLCDSVIHRLTAGRSGILDYGRGTRTVPVDLYNVLVARDRHCRFPGCDRPAHWTDAHHVWAWEAGATTAASTTPAGT